MMSANMSTWEGFLAGTVIGVVSTIGAAVANVKAARNVGDSNVTAAKISSAADNLETYRKALADVNARVDVLSEAVYSKDLKIIEISTQAAHNQTVAERETLRADIEEKRANKAEVLAIRLEAKVDGLYNAFYKWLDMTNAPANVKIEIRDILKQVTIPQP